MAHYWLGKKRSPETIEKMRAAMKEKAKDPEFRKKCGVKNIGKTSSKKGKTYEEIYGKEKAAELRDKCRKRQKRLWKDKDYGYNISKANRGRVGYWAGKTRPAMIGNKFAYKTGKSISEGYVRILAPYHPHANNKGYVPEHRLVMEKHIGRFLTSKEEIHHIDENTSNNKIENLKLFPDKSAHIKFHYNQKNNKLKKRNVKSIQKSRKKRI